MKKRAVSRSGLERRLRDFIAGEERAMQTDDPKDTCAANHRGAINAYKNILREIGCDPEKKQSKQGD